MIPVVCEDIEEDSRFYFKEQYIIISPLMLEKYSDAGANMEIYAWYIWDKDYQGETILRWLLNNG